MIKLPNSVTGQQPTGAPDTLRSVRPRFLAPSPTDTKATAHAVGAHVIRLPRNFEARATKIDGTPVLFARNGKAVHVLVDSVSGVMEVTGFNAQQVEGILEWLDTAASAPETELDAVLERVAARNPGRVDLDPKDTSRDAKRAFSILGLSASVDPNVDNSYVAARATTGDAREVDRLVALADTLDDGASSGDGEVDRLVRLADNLSDG